MTFKTLAARFALVLSCVLMTATPAMAGRLQCVPFAREMSGIDIYGNAKTWWSQAEGRYARGTTPKIGAVLAFEATGKMRLGHVAMVSQIVSDREILLTHANWSRPGGIERDVRAIDVSVAGDWSEVRVWYGPLRDLGKSAYPAKGFIYAAPALQATPLDGGAPNATVTIAANALTTPVILGLLGTPAF
ncbi:MAG: CHAP domain-containing protein [Proteobacteria bacterium ST_bin13]|nr:MAG: CHAP domain-containing protein [Proteobacteria bacterium ST_bin13]